MATNCEINGKKYWRIRKKYDGKTVAFYGENKAHAEQLVEEHEAKLKKQKSDETLTSNMMYYWIENVFKDGGHAEGTKIKYIQAYKKIKDDFQVQIDEITTQYIQDYYTKHGTGQDVHKVLCLFFKWAESLGHRNPMQSVCARREARSVHNIEVFTDDEIKLIVRGDAPTMDNYKLAFKFALGTGLRSGELRATKWGDIKNGIVSVDSQIIIDRNGKMVDSQKLKSKSSYRSVPIPPKVYDEINHFKGDKSDSDYIWTTQSGGFIDKGNFALSFERFLKEIGVPYKSPHALRRTYATMLAKTTPIITLSRLLGHSNIQQTQQYYTFVSDEEKKRAVDKINDMFSE